MHMHMPMPIPMPCHAMPCQAMPYRAMPYLPYLTLTTYMVSGPGLLPPPTPPAPLPRAVCDNSHTDRAGWGHDPRDSPRFRRIGSTSRCQTANCRWDWNCWCHVSPDSRKFSTCGASSQRYRALHDCLCFCGGKLQNTTESPSAMENRENRYLQCNSNG